MCNYIYDNRDAEIERLLAEGYKPIMSDGGGVVTYIFWHPVKKERHSVIVDDCDYDHCSKYCGRIRFDGEAREAYYDHIGKVRDGVTVTIVKGRKIPKGEVHFVRQVRTVHYNHIPRIEVVLGNGRTTSIDNCRLLVGGTAADTDITEKQASYIEYLCKTKKIKFPPIVSKAEASNWISANR